MAATERVTVTLPIGLVESIDRVESNRSRFIAVAVQNELSRRRHQELLQSIRNPHPDTTDLADVGVADWAAHLPPDDEGLVDLAGGTKVRWVEGKGWIEEPE